MHLLKLISCFILVTVYACNNANVDGGPCKYNTEVLPAEVIDIEMVDSTHADIIFRIKEEAGEILKDSVSWYMQNHHWVTLEQLEKEKITIGAICTFEVMTIVDGACNPYVQTLKLDKLQ